jgi:aryl-alcohol dehydrogenase-like predicted oxidoreductase
MMRKVKFGQSDLQVSPLSFGGNVFGWTLDEKKSFEILDALVASGINFIDTADTYSTWVPGNQGGESETIIGKWLKERGNREDLVIATKLGGDMGDGKKGLSAKYVEEAAEASLRRLGTDYIDLYQTHYDDPETPVSETMEALDKLVKAGKVRYLGASNFSAERIAESNQFAQENNLASYISLQPIYNLHDREKLEKEYLPIVEQYDLAVIPYYALASGFLTGKYRGEEDLSKSPRGGGMKQYFNDRGWAILKAMDEVSEEVNAPLAQIAIAWQLHKPYITAPIASATSEAQVKDLVAAASLTLSHAQMEKLDKASEVK